MINAYFPIHYLYGYKPNGLNVAIDTYIAEEILGWEGGQDNRDKKKHSGDFIWLDKDKKYTDLYCSYDASCKIEECFSPSCNKEQALFAMNEFCKVNKHIKFEIKEPIKIDIGRFHRDNYRIEVYGGKFSKYDDYEFCGKRYIFENPKEENFALAICKLLMCVRESQKIKYKIQTIIDGIINFFYRIKYILRNNDD